MCAPTGGLVVTSQTGGSPARFPTVTGRSLLGADLALPHDFPAERTLAVVAFRQWHQARVDRWIARAVADGVPPTPRGLTGMLPAAVVELPVLATGWRARPALHRRRHDGRHRRPGRPGPHDHDLHRTWAGFQRSLAIRGSEEVHALVVTRDGAILARGAGDPLRPGMGRTSWPRCGGREPPAHATRHPSSSGRDAVAVRGRSARRRGGSRDDRGRPTRSTPPCATWWPGADVPGWPAATSRSSRPPCPTCEHVAVRGDRATGRARRVVDRASGRQAGARRHVGLGAQRQARARVVRGGGRGRLGRRLRPDRDGVAVGAPGASPTSGHTEAAACWPALGSRSSRLSWGRRGGCSASSPAAARCTTGGSRVPDLLIAAVAARDGLTVVHYDSDYEIIASVTGQPTRWAAPRGTA